MIPDVHSSRPILPAWAYRLIEWFWLMPIVAVVSLGLLTVLVLRANAGCNAIPDAVCAQLGNPLGCTERLEAAQVQARDDDREVVVEELGVVVRSSGHVVALPPHPCRLMRGVGRGDHIFSSVAQAKAVAEACAARLNRDLRYVGGS